MFDDEANIVPDGSDFVRTILHRSTRSEYPHQVPDLKLPFLHDIIQSAVAASQGDFDYFIYTNSDIGVHERFYEIVADIIRKHKYDAYQINRLVLEEVIHPSAVRPLMGTDSDLDYIYGVVDDGRNVSVHPGADCFILSKEVVNLLHFGDLFLGFGPWDLMLIWLIRNTNLTRVDGAGSLGRRVKFMVFTSRQLSATFHLGKDNGTRKKPNEHTINMTRALLDDLMPCRTVNARDVIAESHWFHLIQGLKNCAKLMPIKYELPPDNREWPRSDEEYDNMLKEVLNDAAELERVKYDPIAYQKVLWQQWVRRQQIQSRRSDG